jgi:5-methylcytosine-specific restriction endonuclease McrA
MSVDAIITSYPPPCVDGGFRHVFRPDSPACVRCRLAQTEVQRPWPVPGDRPNSLRSPQLRWAVVPDPDGYGTLMQLPVSASTPGSRRRAAILRRDGDRCHFCGQRLLAAECTIEHLIPRSRGGSDRLDNQALSCRSCNQLKGQMTEQELIQWAHAVVAVHPERPGGGPDVA